MLGNALLLALREIRRNLLRSSLTTLGIVIGVAAVITMVTVGGGATAKVSAEISNLGSNLLIARPGQHFGMGQRSDASSFTLGDAQAMLNQLGSVAAVAPVASKRMVVVYGNQNWSTGVTGTDNAYLRVTNRSIAEGREFNEAEERAGQAVCIIGATVRRQLFGSQDPLGFKMRLEKFSCEVVGLLTAKGQSMGGGDQDDLVLIPLRTFWRRIAGNQDVSTVYVSGRDGVDTEKVKQDIEKLLRERRHITKGEDDNFSVMDLKEITKTLTGTTQILTALLGAVAAVSLLVGGIGIMNIMLVSVTERTREIGIRLAIGALEGEVLMQFLVEAVVLSSLGGVVGIVLAIGASIGIAGLLNVPFILNPGIVGVAFVFSAVVGVVFGYFPARKAARLNPIDALRHE